jgi:HEAT repeat protein
MTIRILLAATVALGGAAVRQHAAPVAHALAAPAFNFPGLATTPRAPWQADDPADSLYRAGREALNRGDYRAAARTFARIAEQYPSSTYAADALYWEAYAHYSIGETAELRAALSALDAQRSRFPKAATRGDGDEREDERVAALNALLQMNADQAMPILKQVLARRDACSASLREKALFLVSQKQTPETENVMLDVVRNDPDPEVKKRAVFWLGQVNSDRAATALESLLSSTSTNEELREQAVFALMQQPGDRGSAAVRAVAVSDAAPVSLREKAVFWLGQKQSSENATFLRELFARLATSNASGNDDVAQKVLFSLSQMHGVGNERWLMQIAADPKYSVGVRKQAIFSAGQAGVSTADLVGLYDRISDRPIKEQLIWVMSSKNETAATDKLIDIAKRDPDVEMRKKAIFWLGQSQDPRAKQLLLDIINR